MLFLKLKDTQKHQNELHARQSEVESLKKVSMFCFPHTQSWSPHDLINIQPLRHRPRWDLNPQSPAPEADALSIRPLGQANAAYEIWCHVSVLHVWCVLQEQASLLTEKDRLKQLHQQTQQREQRVQEELKHTQSRVSELKTATSLVRWLLWYLLR